MPRLVLTGGLGLLLWGISASGAGCAALKLLLGLAVLVMVPDVQRYWNTYRRINARGSKAGQLTPLPSNFAPLLQPTSISLRHALLFVLQDINFRIALLRGMLDTLLVRWGFGYTATEEDVIYLLLNSTIVVLASVDRHYTDASGTQQMRVTIQDKNFALAHPVHRFDNCLHIDVVMPLHVTPGGTDKRLKGAYITRFDFNGHRVADAGEQMLLVAHCLATIYHPMVHAFFNAVYEGRSEDHLSHYDDMLLHGSYLNDVCHVAPAFMLGTPADWLHAALSHNAARPIPPGHGRQLAALAPCSRYVRFALKARRCVFALCREHHVPFDPEAVFLSSVLHAVDHHVAGTKLRYMRPPREPPSCVGPGAGQLASWFTMTITVFYCPSQFIHNNLLQHKTHRTPFYAALYEQLRRIDPEYADVVTLSVSY